MDELDIQKFQQQLNSIEKAMSSREVRSGLSSLASVQRDLSSNTLSPTPLRDDAVYTTGKNGMGIVNNMKVDIKEADSQFFTPLIQGLRNSTLNVRLTNSIRGIVDPLASEMKIAQIQEMTHNMELHRENILYSRQIVSAINAMSSDSKTYFLDAVLLGYRNFMRNPLWNTLNMTLSALNSVIVRPLWGGFKGILTGFKKRESDTDRIVKAINDQTNFMRTGFIDNEMGFFGRMFRSGLVGSALSGGANLLGIGSRRAQQREDIASQGGGLSMDMRSRLSSYLYGDQIVKRGRQGQGTSNTGMVDILSDIKGVLGDSSGSVSIFEGISELVRNSYRSLFFEQKSLEAQLLHFGIFNSSLEDYRDIETDFREKQTDYMKDIKDATEDSEDTLNKIRRGQVFGMFQRAVNGLLSFAGSIGSTLTGAITGALTGSAFAGGMKSALPALARSSIPVAIMSLATTAIAGLVERIWEHGPSGMSEEDAETVRNTRLYAGSSLSSEAMLANQLPWLDQVKINFGLMDRDEALRKNGLLPQPSSQGYQSGVDMVAQHEGFRREAYQDEAGVWTIGYGTTRIDGRAVRQGDTISRDRARGLLETDYAGRQAKVQEMTEMDLNENQLAALTSLGYNIGMGGLRGSTLIEKLNQGDIEGAASEFDRWNKITDPQTGQLRESQGLINRRTSEKQLFLRPVEEARAIQSPQTPTISTDAINSARTVSGMREQAQQVSRESDSWNGAIVDKLGEILDALTMDDGIRGSDNGTALSVYGR